MGTGGDELFGSYTSFQDLPKLLSFSKYAKWVPQKLLRSLAKQVSAALQPARGPMLPQTRWAKLAEMIEPAMICYGFISWHTHCSYPTSNGNLPGAC